MPKEDPLDKTIDRLRQIVDVHARSAEMEALIAELKAVGSPPGFDASANKAGTHIPGKRKIHDTELDEETPGKIPESGIML
jgi:hypothetical protein